MASFDEEDKPVASRSSCVSSSGASDHKTDADSSNVKSPAHTTKTLASELSMDDDPDFSIPHKASRPVHSAGTGNVKSVLHTKATSQTSGKATSDSMRSERGNRDKTSSQKQNIKHKTSTNASRLANYLLQHVDGASTESGQHKDNISSATCSDRGTHEGNTDEGECELGDGVGSLDWFGLDSDEDIDNFEYFDDETDFPADI